MNEWFDSTLKNEYSFIKLLHRNDKNECKLFRHKTLEKNIVVHTLDNNTSVDVYKVLKSVSHTNILQIYDVFETDGKVVVIEEFIDGITLSDNTGCMTPLGVKRLLKQLCSGLSALHSIGIVHRDITLNNIMLTQNGTAKIIDFNISKLYKSEAVKDSNTYGTVGYAPFEQYGLTSTDEHADIFSVGVVANILLTGKHPSVQLYTKGRLGKVIEICTNINPAKRFKSADEFLSFLG